jgi:hypothetical protein
MKALVNRGSLYRGATATVVAFGALWIPSACGPTGDPTSVVSGFNVAMTDQDIQVDIVFSNQFQLNMDARIPIMDNLTGTRYGEVDLITHTSGSGFTLSLAVDRTQLPKFGELVQFEKTRNLPNDQPMSNYIDAPLYRLTFHPNPEIEVSAYLGPTLTDCYVGAAIGFSFMDEHFPSQLVLTQLIQDQQKRTVAAASIFGPKIEHGMAVAHGGLFIATNVNKLIEYYGKPAGSTATMASIEAWGKNAAFPTTRISQSIPLQSTSKVEISGPNATLYQDPRKLLSILKQLNQDSEAAYPRGEPALRIQGTGEINGG